MALKPETLGTYQAPKDLPGAFCAVAQAVFEDEPCLLLAERNLLSEEGKLRYRYQILKVVRDDRPANAYLCLGKSEDFKTDEIDIPGAIPEGNGKYLLIHTVAELRDLADHLRAEPPGLRFETPPMKEMYQEQQIDQRQRYAKHQSTFGPGGFIVRP